MADEKVYVTKDLYEAAALVSVGIRETGIDIQKEGSDARQIGYFRFAPSEKLDAALTDYASGKLLVEPRLYSANVKRLKSSVSTSFRAPRS